MLHIHIFITDDYTINFESWLFISTFWKANKSKRACLQIKNRFGFTL